MKFKLDGVCCSRITIIDDAEQTPGASREITRFRQDCSADLERKMIEVSPKDTNTDLSEVWDAVNRVLSAKKFKIKRSCFHTDERDGLVWAEFEAVSED